MQITEFEPLSRHRKLPDLGLHRMRDTKRLFGGPTATRREAVCGRLLAIGQTCLGLRPRRPEPYHLPRTFLALPHCATYDPV